LQREARKYLFLIHGYASVNHRLVWGVIETKLSLLQREIDDLLLEP
jgi:uncharacterized protein with HEPN domain